MRLESSPFWTSSITSPCLIALLCLGLLSACGEKTPEDPKKDDTSTTATTEVDTSVAQSEEDPEGETAQKVRPTAEAVALEITPVGNEQVPTSIVFQSQIKLSPGSNSTIGSDRTKVTLTPEMSGKLRRTGTKSFSFTPDQPLAPETSYTVKVESLEVQDNVLVPTKPWVKTFNTPKFELLSMSSPVRTGSTTVTVALTFSAAPKLTDIKRYASWNYEGSAISSSNYRRDAGSSTLNVTLTSPSFAKKSNGDLSLKLKSGLPYNASIKAPKASFKKEVVEGPEVKILGAYKSETGSGYTIRVLCDDNSSPGRRRYYWDRNLRDSFRLKSTCMPDIGSAKNHISISPKVPFQVSSVGRAGFQLHGNFKRGAYKVQIKPGLMTETGGVVRENFEKTITVPMRSPLVRFASKGRYMPRSAWSSVALEHRNAKNIELTIRHIPQENVRFWMSGGTERADERVANVIFKKTIKNNVKEDAKETLWLDLPNWIPNPQKGIYELQATSGNQTDKSRVLLTDLNLIAKLAATPEEENWSKALWVWSLDLKTNAPRKGVKVSAVRRSGNALGSCTTDEKGYCQISLPKEGIDPSKPYALLAEGPKSFTYLKYSELRTKLPNGKVALGKPFQNTSPYNGTIYAERDLYRPGEKTNFVALARQANWKAASNQTPALLILEDSKNRQVFKKMVRLNNAGIATLSYKLDDFAPTGDWKLKMKIANAEVATYKFNVEEFVPERMKVTASFDQKGYHLGGEAPEVKVEAKYLFGGSTAGSKVKVTCSLIPTAFAPPGLDSYTFSEEVEGSRARTISLGTYDSFMERDDTAKVECLDDQENRVLKSSMKLKATVAVLEAGSGRVTRNQATTYLHPSKYFIGLKSNAKNIKSGDTVDVQGIVVDKEGKRVKGVRSIEVSVDRIQREYGWYWDEEWDSERYRYHAHPMREVAQKVRTKEDGTFSAKLVVKSSSSRFVVRAKTDTTQSSLNIKGSYYSWYGGSSRSDITPSPRAPANIVITAPKAIGLGEDTAISFDAPFPGKALVTVETDRVIKHTWLDMKDGANTWKFKLDQFVPNIYVNVLAIKDPKAESQTSFLPGRGMGATSIKVRPKSLTQEVTLEVPEVVRSESKLTVKLNAPNAGEAAWATVAVVDEGILSLTKFKTPSPLDDMLGKRALGVTTYDTIGWTLVMEVMRAAFGGDEDGNDGALERPKAIKPVSLWTGKVKVPASGVVELPFKLPLYRGELRVMAVVVSPSKIGRAEGRIKVRDPLTVQTTLPRFLSAKDEINIPVFVTNTSGKKQNVTVTVSVEDEGDTKMFSKKTPSVTMLSDGTQKLVLKDGASGRALFKLRANLQSGMVKMRVLAKSKDHESRDEGLVPLLPSGPVEQDTQVLKVTGGSDINLSAYLEGWVETSSRSTFWLSNNPYGRAFDHLGFLVRYPYGCIEQTTSSTRPLLFIGDILRMVDPQFAPGRGEMEDKVDHGIRRILSMQTSSGGFAYWPGGTYPDAWGTAYASHMLLDAKKQKFNVPKDRLKRAISWLAQNSDSRSYRYAEPYIHYVLALAGRGRKGRIKQLISNEESKTTSSQGRENLYLLKAALYLAGDQQYEKDLKALDLSPVTEKRSYGYSYYSDRRMRGVMLSTYIDLFGNKGNSKPMADLVAKSLSQARSSYYTTQEIMWGVTGLGKWLVTAAGEIKDVDLTLGGKKFKPSIKSKAGLSWDITRASEYPEASIKIGGTTTDDLYLMVSTSGVKASPSVQPGGQGLQITRTYYDAKGAKLYGSPIELGQVIYAKITLENKTGEKVQNIALVERLGAGFEIENPNLGQGDLPTALKKGLWKVDHINRRDDRVEAFGTLFKGQSASIVVALRATSAGTFGVPSASSEAMYDPRKWALSPRERLVVRAPWGN